MGLWRYQADGGDYTVREAELREVIRAGKLPGEARVQNAEDGKWHRVDVDFLPELRAAAFATGKRDHDAHKAQRGFISKNYRGLTALLILALGGGYYWWSNRITCSGDQVQNLVRQVVKEKLLKLAQGEVALGGIATINSLDSGGAKCSANAAMSGTGSDDGLREIEYTAERRGDKLYVTARITR